MPAVVIDGRELAKEIESALADEVKKLASTPLLAVVLVGDDPASKIYVGTKTKRANACGIDAVDFHYPDNITTEELKSEIKKIVSGENGSRIPNGILVQLPLPKNINVDEVMTAVPHTMDVDGLLPLSQGLMFQGQDTFLPCTPHGVLKLIDKANILLGQGDSIAGKKAVVLGRSLIVGKPAGMLLLKKNCTVTYCHSFTKNLQEECRQADILIAAIGRPRMVTADYVKPGAIVIDVGINRNENGRIVGDVDYDSVSQIAGAITPVPGGVGPMTIAMLLSNVVKAGAAKAGPRPEGR